jgi:protein-L-isoaspartate(D-aspartate) O-methyltransferase
MCEFAGGKTKGSGGRGGTLGPIMSSEGQEAYFANQRRGMVDAQLRARGIRDEGVLQAMARVPRHQFVAESFRAQAYEDHPVPIGENQTVSQPYIVALTLEALGLEHSYSVLEIGTGSGYQTALLAELTHRVFSLERHESLARQAEATLKVLGYSNVTTVVADGGQGLARFAPFDAIAVAAAAPRIPEPLFEQLREGGRMVIPVGEPHSQELQLVRKVEGRALVASLGACAFVPLIGEHGYVAAS